MFEECPEVIVCRPSWRSARTGAHKGAKTAVHETGQNQIGGRGFEMNRSFDTVFGRCSV